MVAYVDDRTVENINGPVAKAKAGPAHGSKESRSEWDDVDDRTVENINGPVAKAKAGPARGTKRSWTEWDE